MELLFHGLSEADTLGGACLFDVVLLELVDVPGGLGRLGRRGVRNLSQGISGN